MLCKLLSTLALVLALGMTTAQAEEPKTPQDILKQVNNHLKNRNYDMAIFVGNKVKKIDPDVKNTATYAIYSTMGTCYMIKAHQCYAKKDFKGASLNFRFAAAMNRLFGEAVRANRGFVRNFPALMQSITKDYSRGLSTN